MICFLQQTILSPTKMMFLKQVVGILLSASLAAGSSCTTKAQRKAW